MNAVLFFSDWLRSYGEEKWTGKFQNTIFQYTMYKMFRLLKSYKVRPWLCGNR